MACTSRAKGDSRAQARVVIKGLARVSMTNAREHSRNGARAMSMSEKPASKDAKISLL